MHIDYLFKRYTERDGPVTPVRSLSIMPDTILVQLSFGPNLLHTRLDSLHDMIRIAWSQRRFGHGHIHRQPGHSAEPLTRLAHLVDLPIAVQGPCKHSDGRLGIVHGTAIVLFSHRWSLPLQQEGYFDCSGGAAGDIMNNYGSC